MSRTRKGVAPTPVRVAIRKSITVFIVTVKFSSLKRNEGRLTKHSYGNNNLLMIRLRYLAGADMQLECLHDK
jgi:hypothetical protein